MRFGGVVAIHNVDFEMARGQVHCLIGPNGAGKSTFFKMITGQLRPTAGIVTFADRTISGFRPFEIARLGIGIKTQVPKLFDELDVRENLWLAARRRKKGAAANRLVDSLLDELQLAPLADKLVGRLAHGQRQWVEIGGVLAGEPSLVLLDEPAAGMSDAEVDRTAQLIGSIKKDRSVLVVEHDMRFIRMIADHVTVFHQGQTFTDGTAQAVLSDPRVRDIYLGKSFRHDA
ncbi:ABC transporter ATP-binding protein [Mesorhizobium sp. CO1-1-8]|uniref:ABC transporter ATP-binding protein n=1 Tax=Mesorhizobium sp. CO1-1-8 TaxID=2876631 RepID=UPI001CD083F3|nr:ABC transporter ATP-binding protein [Mesorhizobium sp. CO1-1-8]MBZ9772547.1 ABC transporter ATP-binding protein [Mesorhizobium sp. CO1-1-8]